MNLINFKDIVKLKINIHILEFLIHILEIKFILLIIFISCFTL